MENCSFILFLRLVMQGDQLNLHTLTYLIICIFDDDDDDVIYEYFAPLSDYSLKCYLISC
ncbi:hypothetical protein T07_14460 [Trichinella nelsoni]|uniref:Uncharacterized protein n=1 Tax=Trichinella nelsoni TaxID=6336 RepID=A0A0V0S787_9BILA|nr:hypothetical protein T07_14460 [Trichinella nelsoni]